jgi:hypothetical protein
MTIHDQYNADGASYMNTLDQNEDMMMGSRKNKKKKKVNA